MRPWPLLYFYREHTTRVALAFTHQRFAFAFDFAFDFAADFDLALAFDAAFF